MAVQLHLSMPEHEIPKAIDDALQMALRRHELDAGFTRKSLGKIALTSNSSQTGLPPACVFVFDKENTFNPIGSLPSVGSDYLYEDGTRVLHAVGVDEAGKVEEGSHVAVIYWPDGGRSIYKDELASLLGRMSTPDAVSAVNIAISLP